MFGGDLAVLRVWVLTTLPAATSPSFRPMRPFAAGRRPGGWPWGGICENGGLGAPQFSAPEFGMNSRP